MFKRMTLKCLELYVRQRRRLNRGGVWFKNSKFIDASFKSTGFGLTYDWLKEIECWNE